MRGARELPCLSAHVESQFAVSETITPRPLFHRIMIVPRLAGADLRLGRTMASAEVAKDSRGPRHILRWAGLAAAAGLGLVVVARLGEAIRQPPSGPTVARYGISQSHCTQFIALAKAKFGSDWKYRLDPRDTTCAAQIQQEWEHQWNPRFPSEPLQQPTVTISAPIAPAVDAGPSPIDTHLLNPETYCLNVISLAQARYKTDWALRVTPAEAASCGVQIEKAASQ